ncbi:MAG: hypothetical protein ALECFALPRED_004935 [Alectoria fallacina]|uniref:Uncharacterized protein n=1 Tax=Alectoria fallacina TaxID=1903189 RepID=A0A8H3IS04_9LECA|nr:MAG: hypothetical protein ALECFALPRED_004935 [Alectoria fallacina]
MTTSSRMTYAFASAFNAIISASVVALGVSYAIPPAINCLRGRKMLPPRPFVLPGPLGWICNLLGISYVTVTTVLFLFPPTLPVTGSNMNYCIVAFFIVIVISVVQWFIDGRKNYKGPVVELVGEGEDGTVYAADNLDDKAEGAHGNGAMGHVNGNG